MAEDVISTDRVQNPPDEIPTSSRSKRHASKAASSTWMELTKRKSPRGDPLAGVRKRWQKCSEEQCQQVTRKRKRPRVTIQENSAKQLDALGQCLPDLPESDTKILALRMYYLELSDGVSASHAQEKVSRMFLISPRTVRRWAENDLATPECS